MQLLIYRELVVEVSIILNHSRKPIHLNRSIASLLGDSRAKLLIFGKFQECISESLVVRKEFDAAASFTADSGADTSHMIMDTVDDSTRTFWTSPAEGAGFTFTADGFGLSSFQFQHGPAGYAKVKKIKVTANDVENVVDVPESGGWHTVEIPGPYGYTGSAWGDIVVEILEVHPGSKPEVAVSEFKAKATNYEGI